MRIFSSACYQQPNVKPSTFFVSATKWCLRQFVYGLFIFFVISPKIGVFQRKEKYLHRSYLLNQKGRTRKFNQILFLIRYMSTNTMQYNAFLWRKYLYTCQFCKQDSFYLFICLLIFYWQRLVFRGCKPMQYALLHTMYSQSTLAMCD